MFLLRLAFVSVVVTALPAMAEPGFKYLQEVPSEFGVGGEKKASSSGVAVGTDTLEFAEPQFEVAGPGEVRAVLPGARVLRVETQPDLAFVERTYALPRGMRAHVRVDNPVLFVSPGPIPLHSENETHVWSNNPRFALAGVALSRFYPGKLADVTVQADKATVRFYPLQWDRQTGELLRVQSLTATLFAQGQEATSASAYSASLGEAVIVARKAMLPAAQLLQRFHSDRYGVASAIVTVESIAEKEAEIAESDLPDGYKDRTAADAAVVAFDPGSGAGYDYSLARKIAGFFQRALKATGSKLKYITLLGDVQSIPPSYYFSTRTGFEPVFGVTDQCYAAVEQCLEPRAAVGRLPLQSEAQTKAYLAKVDNWITHSNSAASELSLFGGKGFGGPMYVGELGTLRALTEKADWRGVQKFYRTKANYTRDAVLDLVRGNNDSSLVYSLDHGTGNEWMVEKQSVSSLDIEKLSVRGSKVNPLVFSIACSNGAYDQNLVREDVFDDLGQGTESVGVSLIRSAAGAVGYFGSARAALGAPVYAIDSKGNLDLKDSNHGLKILDTALELYRVKGAGHLGDFVQASLAQYAADPASSVLKDRFRWTYLNSVLLGDPAMRMPERSRRETVSLFARAVDEIQGAFVGFPAIVMPESGSAAVRIESKVAVEATLFLQSGLSTVRETVIGQKALPAGDSDIAFSDSVGRQNYFMRLENKEGVPIERQVWFRTQ